MYLNQNVQQTIVGYGSTNLVFDDSVNTITINGLINTQLPPYLNNVDAALALSAGTWYYNTTIGAISIVQ